jgi:GH35 family endo-1,4-beta-xylanase
MKLNRIILPVVVGALTLSSCYDEKMEWGTPEGHYPVVSSDIPLALAEKIANYDFIKAYVPAGMTVGVGIGADLYIAKPEFKKVVDDNFQMITLGNQMKHSSVVTNSGSLDFTTIDKFLAAIPTDMQVYGHTLLWHTQQKQMYLKTLIDPQVIVETDPGDVLENIIQNSDFETGTKSPWGSWGNSSTSAISAKGQGYNSNYSMVLTNPKDANAYSAQAAYDLSASLKNGTTYVFQFYAKANTTAGQLQVQVQNSKTYGSQQGYSTFNVGTSWVLCQSEFTCTYDDVNRLLINFGKVAGEYQIDNFRFGKKVEEKMINVLSGDNLNFDGGTIGSWGGWGNSSTRAISDKGFGYNSDYSMKMVNPTDANSWSAQTAITLPQALTIGKTYMYSVMVKASVVNPDFTLQVQNSTTYAGEGYVSAATVADTWVPIEGEFTAAKDGMNRLCINFGKVAGTYYVDNIKFGEKKATSAIRKKANSATTGIVYKYKTPEEKKAALLGAMETWIKGMMQHCGSRVAAWDVINEPITDNNLWRGIDGNFMTDDTAPVENNGLTLNWADGHFYWGYYIGKEYAYRAFEYARKYAPSGTKLFVNDYNLESNPNKLSALIDFVKYIEQNGQTVDGIGTQMHVSADTTAAFKAKVDNMFKTMAATGKLVRVTELDVAVGTANPSAGQLEVQALTYKYIAESFLKNVPVAQRSGITVWSLTDSPDEHEFWLPDDRPNLFDKNYGRKHAYKTFCDGLAGFDVSKNFSGDDYINAYK